MHRARWQLPPIVADIDTHARRPHICGSRAPRIPCTTCMRLHRSPFRANSHPSAPVSWGLWVFLKLAAVTSCRFALYFQASHTRVATACSRVPAQTTQLAYAAVHAPTHIRKGTAPQPVRILYHVMAPSFMHVDDSCTLSDDRNLTCSWLWAAIHSPPDNRSARWGRNGMSCKLCGCRCLK